MWLFKRFILICVVMTGLTACGFKPIYSNLDSTKSNIQLNNIEIANIPNWDGQFLRNQLIDSLYKKSRPINARYLLKVESITNKTQELGIDQDAVATREQLTTTAIFHLIDNQTGKKLLSRKLRSINGYNILDNQLSNRSTYQNAQKKGLINISEQIETNILLFLNRK